MVEPLRLSLAVPTEPRNSSIEKDALTKNAFLEVSKSGTNFCVKRPGFFVGTEGVTTGLNRGIFYHNGVIWVVNSGNGLTGYGGPIGGGGFSFPYIVVSNEDFL